VKIKIEIDWDKEDDYTPNRVNKIIADVKGAVIEIIESKLEVEVK